MRRRLARIAALGRSSMTARKSLSLSVRGRLFASMGLALLLSLHTVYATGSTFDSAPALELQRPSGEIDTTLKLFPSSEGVTPTEWLVSTADGRQVWFDLEQLPALRVSHRSLWLGGRRVTHLRSARCYFPSEHASDDVTTCTYAATQLVLVENSAPRAQVSQAPTPGLRTHCVTSDSRAFQSKQHGHDPAAQDPKVCAPWVDQEASPTDQLPGPDNDAQGEPAPKLHELGETSDIAGTLAKYWSDGETVLVSPPLIADPRLTIFHGPTLDLPM